MKPPSDIRLAQARFDPRQTSLYGDEHEWELRALSMAELCKKVRPEKLEES